MSLRTKKPKGMEMTDSAAVKVKELIAEEGDDRMALRVAVRPGGCSGLSYEMFFDAETSGSDIVTEQGGVRLVVDEDSLPWLSGAVLDYKDGLMDSGFTIENPNVSRSCGCGNSFS
ncbi:MAG: iron-sulfur cluster insertion protein ErpA [Actinobacteria bacterium ATB1]|nr:iron-sulfur cluster insertion protein ErpA [Actinobacteria bacterium ATB1]